MAGTRYPLEVRPILPAALSRLHDLAGNLYYSWDRHTRSVFRRIDPALWEDCHHNPSVFLRRVPQARFDELADDHDFVQELNTTLAAFDQYHEATDSRSLGPIDPARDRIAYFCMEFGLHESLKLYSGGLGILAGDHCKAASDLRLPFVAVGLLYRQGYFAQTIDIEGRQHAHYYPVELSDMPVRLATDAGGAPVQVSVPFPGRDVHVRVWVAAVGHVQLYLLDTETPDNERADRQITYQLYGGDGERRIAQEMILGIGGVRAMRALGGVQPNVWHVNEGHPAFSIIERCRERVCEGLDFDTALEVVAATTVFTTHTPVAAGHDLFPGEMITKYLHRLTADLGTTAERLLELGASPQNEGRFNMTALALRGSRHHNGVSRIHGRVAAEMEHYIWPRIPPAENPIGHITNGVHVPTFLARDWLELFDSVAPGWRSHLSDPEFWSRHVAAIPDNRFRAVRQLLKGRLLEALGAQLEIDYRRRGINGHRIRSMRNVLCVSNIEPLVIGFARRFATYKRASLLFHDAGRLADVLGDPERPVIVVFAGKAHPADEPGQNLIQQLVRYSAEPAFRDRVFFIESYGMTLARMLTSGVDVWLNTPLYPLEASGTSGQKAAINGAVNLSVMDGWWGEGYAGDNGWAIEPHDESTPAADRDALEAEELLDLLEEDVIPCWFADGASGCSDAWIRMARSSMSTILPRFNAERMVMDYVERLYAPAVTHGRRLAADGATPARELTRWKHEVRDRWNGVRLRWLTEPVATASTGDTILLQVGAELNDLAATDLVVECVVEPPDAKGAAGRQVHRFRLVPDDRAARYELELPPLPNGMLHYSIRAYPFHQDLAHPFETGCMTWL